MLELITLFKIRGDHFRFGSVFIKEKQPNRNYYFLKKPKPVQTDQFQFGFFRTKTGSNWFTRFFRFDLIFSGLALFFPGLAWLFFSFFGFRLKKLKPNRTNRFF